MIRNDEPREPLRVMLVPLQNGQVMIRTTHSQFFELHLNSDFYTFTYRSLSLVFILTDSHSHSASNIQYTLGHRQVQPSILVHVRSLSTSPRKLGIQDDNQDNPARTKELFSRRGLKELNFEYYPRILEVPLSFGTFREEYDTLEDGATRQTLVQIAGRVSAIRTAGAKLVFVDIREQSGGSKLQVVLTRNNLPLPSENNGPTLKEFARSLQRGDVISVKGYPHRTSAGELSVQAQEIPMVVSPCLHQIPDAEFGEDSDWAHDKHVEMLSRPETVQSLVVRSTVVQTMQKFLTDRDFVMVQTPILAAAAGGAIARPFETTATEFPDRKLALRIAPELWLKRLVIGGMKRVAEIGPSFRNEGLDKTHNPEFTTCEFYAAFWNIQKLKQETQAMVREIAGQIVNVSFEKDSSVQATLFKLQQDEPWPEIDFIPALNTALGQDLPNLASSDARDQLLEIFASKGIAPPPKPTLPRLVDKLSSVYLEPQCDDATWIVNPPECLSPLAKSYTHPSAPNEQPVAARAELFIKQKEVANCYEEENSPVEQRRKFIDQQVLARVPGEDALDDEAMRIDEDYLKALEWGLPPTGGWGCGIDRLVMLLTGKEKISDVLSFGNLRQVTRGAERWETKTEVR